MSITIGSQFKSFSDLKDCIEKYKLNSLNEYFIRDCRTLAYQRKRALSTVEHLKYSKAEDLKYYYIRYSCIHGGRPYEIKKSARKTKTFKQGCKAGFFLKLCGDVLEVRELFEEHCHKTSKAIFRTLYHQRLKLPKDIKNDVQSCLAKGGNKKQIRRNIIKQTACHITLKDLTNLNRKKVKVKSFEECVKMLENDYNCEVEMLLEENKTLQAFYFQDTQMKDCYESFPEILFMSRTPCLGDNTAFCYILLIEDSNGNSEVVAVCFILKENFENLNWFIEIFKSHNNEWKKTKIVFTDKDAKERSVLKKTFPNTHLIISFSHVNQIFNRDIDNIFGIKSQEITLSEHFLHKLAHCESTQQYDKIYDEFKSKVSDCVLNYYNKTWHFIREHWVVGFIPYKPENRLEQMNSKLRLELKRYSCMEKCLQNLFEVINSMRLETDTKTAEASCKIRKSSAKLAVYKEYERLLTPFAYTLVEESLNKLYKKESFTNVRDRTFLFKDSDLLFEVTPWVCGCLFFMGLPCGHIFECRRILSLDLFDETLCGERWKNSYYRLHQRVYQLPTPDLDESSSDSETSTSFSKRTKLTKQQKFTLMQSKCLKLSRLGAEVDGIQFNHRYETIKSLIATWNKCEDVVTNEEFEEIPEKIDPPSQESIHIESVANAGNEDHNYSQIYASNIKNEDDITSDVEYYMVNELEDEEVSDEDYMGSNIDDSEASD